MSTAEAIACVRRGDFAGADAAVRRALAADPRDVEAMALRAMLLHQSGDVAGAIDAFNAVIAAAPHNVSAHFNRATLLHQAGRFGEAVHGYARVLQLDPRDVTAWIQRAHAERALGRLEDVVFCCTQALEVDPKNSTALNEGAAALGKLGHLEEALAWFERLVEASPESALAHTNRGRVLSEMGRYEAAEAAYRAAIRAHPNYAPAWNNLGVVRAAQGRYDEAIEAYESASLGDHQTFDVGHPLFNKATLLLLRGDYEHGFALYAHRFAVGAVNAPPKVETAPAWRGQRLHRVLRIRSEQGVGEQLLFARLLPLVFERTQRVALDCDPRLAGLLADAYPSLEAVLAPDELCTGAEAHVAMGDLAGVLQLSPADISALPTVLSANAAKTKELRAKYEGLANGRPIAGIAWASPRAKMGASRRAALEHWGALLREPYFFISLQCGDDRADGDLANALFGCQIFQDDNVDQMQSIAQFAAQLAALDGIVTVSNTTAHVAGAFGLPAFVLLPPAHGLDWYWGLQGERTPWHPSLTLLRRAIDAPWDGQIAAAAEQLRNALLL